MAALIIDRENSCGLDKHFGEEGKCKSQRRPPITPARAQQPSENVETEETRQRGHLCGS